MTFLWTKYFLQCIVNYKNCCMICHKYIFQFSFLVLIVSEKFDAFRCVGNCQTLFKVVFRFTKNKKQNQTKQTNKRLIWNDLLKQSPVHSNTSHFPVVFNFTVSPCESYGSNSWAFLNLVTIHVWFSLPSLAAGSSLGD